MNPLDLASFAFGLAVLLKGSDLFVESASRLARFLRMPPLVIGLTIVAIGTSLPELATSVVASLQNSPSIAVGNVIGSNIANILLILGVSGLLFNGVNAQKKVFQKDCFIMFAVTVLFYISMMDGILSPRQGLFFLLLFFLYTLIRLKMRFEFRKLFDFRTYLHAAYHFNHRGHHFQTKLVLDRKLASSCFRQFSLLVIGLAGVTYGAQLLVDAAKGIALALGVSAEIIAVTVIAVGTSLPEASVSITAIRKKLPEIALGNIIGSNIAN
ncbi:MAG TPA: calcium/sodium antiporter, partial [Candidatus Diapherotrites archaeon]|nr:calcium/sodium antiporter [Candidatus Diapherotrites archaeon]